MNTVYLDIETEGLNPFSDPVVTVQILTAGQVHIFQGQNIPKLKPLLESSYVIGHNLKFEQKFLKQQYGINLNHLYDTWIAEIVISGGLMAGKKGTSLKDLCKKYLNMTMSKEEQTTFRINKALTKDQIRYAALDVQVLPGIYEQQQIQINELQLQEVIKTEMEAVTGIAWLELSGINVDNTQLQEIKVTTIQQRDKAYQEIIDIFMQEGIKINQQRTLTGGVQYDINLNSPEQLKNCLNQIGIKCNSTSAEALRHSNHPVINAILEYKKCEKHLSTFIEKIPSFRDATTGRIHPSFNQIGAYSGRFTCRNPNMQQQPHTPEWRSIYTAAAGNRIITADYSQIELRILAEVSQDEHMINAYNQGQDLHTLTASKVFNVPLEQVQKEQRSIAKSVNFGTVYGIGAQGLKRNLKAVGIEVSKDEARSFINSFYAGYPGVADYLQNIQRQGLRNLSLKNKAGRWFKFNQPVDDQEEGTIRRRSQNLPIQSLCADMVKIAISSLYHELEPKQVKFINCVHDEVVMECSLELAPEVADTIKTEMEAAGRKFITSIPVIAEVTTATCWQK